jgi:hypothetical protein
MLFVPKLYKEDSLLWHGLTKTNDRPDLSSEAAPDIDETVTGHEPQTVLDTKTDWPTDRRS